MGKSRKSPSLIGKSTINGPPPITMLNCQRDPEGISWYIMCIAEWSWMYISACAGFIYDGYCGLCLLLFFKIIWSTVYVYRCCAWYMCPGNYHGGIWEGLSHGSPMSSPREISGHLIQGEIRVSLVICLAPVALESCSITTWETWLYSTIPKNP